MLRWTTTLVANAASTTSVAASQTPGAAGNLTLTASPVTFGSGTAQKITIISTADLSNRTFTITGLDVTGATVTETVTGPNNATAASTYYYKSVSTIAISGAAAGALTAGNAADSVSSMYPVNLDANPISIGAVGIVVSGSPHFNIDYTYSNVAASTFVYSASTTVWITPTAFSDKTATTDGAITVPVNAIRLRMTAAGTVTAILNQAGGGFR